MKISASGNFSNHDHFMKGKDTTGISRLKEIEFITLSKKDINNFKPLYEAYFHPILNYIYQKVNDADIAADIASQVFLKAMTGLKKYKIGEFSFGSWLYRIAFNETMLYFRRTKIKRLIVLDDALINGMHEEMFDFSREAILRAVEMMIRKLEATEFELIELRFYKNMSFREIGFIVGCSENTAKVRLHRLIKRLKVELLKENHYETL
jgi:RNA polymerase sigma-70 factor, ECF subfamily